MKIPLEIAELPKGAPRLILNVTILFTRIGLRPIRFIVDTGSPKTFIGATDVIKLNLRPYGGVVDKVHLGMKEISLTKVRIDKFYMKTDEVKIVPNVIVSSLKMTVPTEISDVQCMGVPNIMGLDFLKDNELNLHYFSSKNEAFLDK